jgi:hypothetical protein
MISNSELNDSKRSRNSVSSQHFVNTILKLLCCRDAEPVYLLCAGVPHNSGILSAGRSFRGAETPDQRRSRHRRHVLAGRLVTDPLLQASRRKFFQMKRTYEHRHVIRWVVCEENMVTALSRDASA